MLVLTRKLNEAIQIGEEIEISVVSIQDGQVKLGINAPKHIEIHRKEIYLSIQQENSSASNLSADILKKLTNSKP
ncbi:carbon storage regulator CsrA [Bacillus mangrovi]|uniref:Translational regulator CsrA n=1 Tax=Metabacillus mangrovi TaxID=1491830 RepID=A0A7X2S8C4_9BACI|nr:carbon storage regulator CsrA [Metabacillus mangrovi]MTH55061.1 carbon storage regulator CsrA [Metabacillus mangrovi]